MQKAENVTWFVEKSVLEAAFLTQSKQQFELQPRAATLGRPVATATLVMPAMPVTQLA